MKTSKLILIGMLIIAFAAMIAPVMTTTTAITGNVHLAPARSLPIPSPGRLHILIR